MCPEQIIELMHEYLDDEITPEQERVLREHLQSCKECETIFNELKKTIAFVKSISTYAGSRRFYSQCVIPFTKREAEDLDAALVEKPSHACCSLIIFYINDGKRIFYMESRPRVFCFKAKKLSGKK